MYIEKFTGDSIDEVIKNVKFKLGPDAIILKTTTNKGIKGAFKKGRIEITAAIREKDYEKKAKVDMVLDDSQKNKFYQNSAKNISDSIENYSGNNYGKLGLNKVVSTVAKTAQNAGEKIRSGLDEFLSTAPYEDHTVNDPMFSTPKAPIAQKVKSQVENDSFEIPQMNTTMDYGIANREQENKIHGLEGRISELETLILKLNEEIETKKETLIEETKEDVFEEVRSVLAGAGLNSGIIKDVLKYISFNLNSEEKKDFDTVFEHVLKYIAENINVKMPMFSNTEVANEGVITLLISNVASGQTSACYKLAAMDKKCKILTYGKKSSDKNFELTKHLHKFDIKEINSISEIYAECRKAIASKQRIIIDFKLEKSQIDQLKQLTQGLRRSFNLVEVMVCLSAIHGEDYNRKILSNYKEIADGVIISHVDQCLNFGALVNLNFYGNLPYMFYGTGEVIPQDIEDATSERLIAGMFKF